MCGINQEGEQIIGEPCLEGDNTNQLTNSNTIKVKHLDTNDKLADLARIREAFVKYDKDKHEAALRCINNPTLCQRSDVQDSDFLNLGILVTKVRKAFSNQIPICLPAGNAKIPELDQRNDDEKDAIITFVGWGRQYSEYPDGKESGWTQSERNPESTSCTTNQFGVYWDTTEEKTKFKPCNIAFLKGGGEIGKKNWKGCKMYTGSPDDLPMNYEFEQCEYYWRKAREYVRESQNQDMIRDFEEVKKIKIHSDCLNWVPECLKEELFRKHGWCEVQSDDHIESMDNWGLCDEACKHVEVLYFPF